MDQPPNIPSEPPRPLSLTERLKAEANGHAPAEELTASFNSDGLGGARQELSPPPLAARIQQAIREEATPSLMARRFAPEGHVIAPDPEPRPDLRAPIEPLAPPQPPRAFGMQALIAALILVALVPSAMLGGMIWSGMIATPWTTQTPREGASSAMEQASVAASLGAATILPKRDVEVPAIALSAPDRLEAGAGQQVDFALALDGTDALPARSIITVSGLPQGATFSDGRPFGETEWTLRADEIGDLKLTLPPRAAGVSTLAVQLVAPDGRVITDARTTLSVAPDPKAPLVQRPEEATLIGDLIAHGNKMVSVGYFPGARAYFQRAAEAGSGEAALALGETYDPGFIAQMGAQGIRPGPDQAIAWYERAKALGAAGADDKIATLKVAAKEATADSDAPAVDVAEQGAAPSREDADADAAPIPIAVEGAAQAPAGAAPSGVTPVDEASELVVLTGAVNVRESPSPNAKTVRVMEEGTKLHAIGRKGGWVQVTDPETQETGWVYSRYVTTASAAGAAAQ